MARKSFNSYDDITSCVCKDTFDDCMKVIRAYFRATEWQFSKFDVKEQYILRKIVNGDTAFRIADLDWLVSNAGGELLMYVYKTPEELETLKKVYPNQEACFGKTKYLLAPLKSYMIRNNITFEDLAPKLGITSASTGFIFRKGKCTLMRLLEIVHYCEANLYINLKMSKNSQPQMKDKDRTYVCIESNVSIHEPIDGDPTN